jgi:GxxExxY protein
MVTHDDGPDLLNDLPEPDPDLDALARRVIEAAIAVHIQLGPGLPESHYGNALCIEFRKRGIRFVPQARVDVLYDGQRVGRCKLDFLVEERLVVEIKSVDRLEDVFKAQVLIYLKVTNCRLGLLINFNEERVVKGIRRIINPYHKA